MKYKEYDEKMTSMLSKIGNENSNLILDDVATFLTDNQRMNEELDSKAEEIERLKSLNQKLQQVNGNLLLQIPVSKEEKIEESKSKIKTKEFSYYDVFDEKGNFKK